MWEPVGKERATLCTGVIWFKSNRLEKGQEKIVKHLCKMENGTAKPANSKPVCHIRHKQFCVRIGLAGHLCSSNVTMHTIMQLLNPAWNYLDLPALEVSESLSFNLVSHIINNVVRHVVCSKR